MHQDPEPALTREPPTPQASTSYSQPQSPRPAAPTEGPVISILRTSSPLQTVASPSQDPVNTVAETRRSTAGHSDRVSFTLAHQDRPTSPPRRRSSFAERGPYDHDAAAFPSQALRASPPLPALPTEVIGVPSERPVSDISWIVPEKLSRRKTVKDRLDPTLETASKEKDKSARKARITGLILNIALGLQVLLGALTTGLSATAAKNTSLATAILGGLSTLVASYLARTRGSNEPQRSTLRAKDLEQFIRECSSFVMDCGDSEGHEYDEQIEGFRRRLEELLGNIPPERLTGSAV